jgi:KaiC/GvpD/RAD55 family RecA-like ATPase
MDMVEPYNLTPKFERLVTYLACTRPSFYGRIACRLDPEGLGSEPCKHLLEACHQINKDTGRGPSDTILVLQRLRTRYDAGRMAMSELSACADVLDAVEDSHRTLPSEDDVIAELTPVVQGHMKTEATMRMLREVAAGGDIAKVIQLLQESQRVGQSDSSIGTMLGRESFSHIRRLRTLPRFPTGVPELDAELGGGLFAGNMGMLIGGPGDGKSMTLSQFAANCVRKNQLVGYVTLELQEERVLARIIADLCGIPINAVVGTKLEQAESQIVERQQAGRLGSFVVKYMTPHATTVEDLKTWWDEVTAQIGRPLDALFIDYADKLSAPEEKSEYQAMRKVYEGLRVWATELNLPLWTASQSKAKGKDQRIIGLYDAADSTHKVRVADVVVTLNVSDDKSEIKVYMAKNRNGEAGGIIGPIPTNFAMGRTIDSCSL